MRKQVEGLEDDPDVPPDAVEMDAVRGDVLAFHDDPSGIDRLEQVDAAQERGLARSRCADEADDLVLGDHEVDPAQDLELAERLVQALDAQGLGGHLAAPDGSPPAVASDQPVDHVDQRDRHHDEHEGDPHQRREVVGRRRLDLGIAEDLDDTDERDQDGVLLEADEVVEQRWDHPADGLRHDDETQRLEARQPQ